MNEKIRELIKALEAIGQTFSGISYTEDGLFLIYAHDPKLAGKRPFEDFCRDRIDYTLLMKEWKNKGTFLLYADKDLDAAIDCSILKLVQKSI